ncbi:MAG: hypothetical protein QM802_21355 [Agriterribacter sp.]
MLLIFLSKGTVFLSAHFFIAKYTELAAGNESERSEKSAEEKLLEKEEVANWHALDMSLLCSVLDKTIYNTHADDDIICRHPSIFTPPPEFA